MLTRKTQTLFIVLFSIYMVGFTGCEEKTEDPGKDIKNNQIENTDTNDSQQNNQTANLEGTWIGTFDQRKAVLKITEQNGNEFKGKISIAYRNQINQEIKGTIDTASNTISMKDLLHSRYMGKYKGELSDSGKTISGTFTMDLNGEQFNFKLKKK